MDLPADRPTPTNAPPVQPTPWKAVRAPRRRRPTGEPPPLPYRLQTSGVGWLIAAGVLIVLSIVVFRGGLRGPAIAVTVVDDAVVGWLAGSQVPGFVGMMRGLAALSSWWVLNGLALGLLLTLLVLRRIRHLIVSFTLAYLVVTTAAVVGASTRRPRPFGVAIQAGWGGWALPSLQVTFLAALLVGILYTLVPEGRWRNTGKWVAAVLIALTAVGRIALGADAPTDVLVGVAIGVTLPLVTFRILTPSEVFPVTYRRGRSAHLDVTGARGVAIRRGLEDQLGLVLQDVRPFGLAGSAGSTPLRITVKGADGEEPKQLFGKLYAQSHLRADRWYKLGRELLYGRLEDEKPFNTVRRLVQQEDYALRLCRDAGLPSPTPTGSWSSLPSGSTCWSPSFSTAPPSSARRRSTTRSSVTASASCAGCGTPAWPTATSSRPICWSATAGCCS
jgi:membrane-associated phospholipid phosphatase